jgi:hypothetical protein
MGRRFHVTATNDGGDASAVLSIEVDGPARERRRSMLGGVQAVGAGNDHTCALVSGHLWCWGDNTTGDLGNNTSGGVSLVPVAVVGL